MLRLASLIFRNVFRNRRRSLLTLASTAVSLSLLAMLLAIYQGVFYGDDIAPTEALHLITRHRVSLTQLLPASYQPRIQQVPGVVKISDWTWFQGVYKEPKNFFARFAVDADIIFDIEKDWQVAADQLAAFKHDRAGCAIGEKIAKDYDIKLGQTITIVGDIYPVTLELKVDAIYQHPPFTEALVFHREYLTELLPKTSAQRDSASTFVILAQSADQVPAIGRAIDALFDNSPDPTRTESEKEFGRTFLSFLGNIKLFLSAVCAAVTFTILLVSANTVAMAVRERTRETAILRTIGYTPFEILQLIVGESIFISLIGGMFGLVFGWLLSFGVTQVAGGFGVQPLKWQAAIIVFGMAILIGLFASLVPAIIASRKNVVESLRFTG